MDAEEQEEEPGFYPKGIKWYGQWEDASYRLPRSCHIPCEVKLSNGQTEFMLTVTGDWREVVKWRQVQLTAGELRRRRKALKILAQDVELMG